VFERTDEGWLLRVFQGLEATAALARLDVALPSAEVYFGVAIGDS